MAKILCPQVTYVQTGVPTPVLRISALLNPGRGMPKRLPYRNWAHVPDADPLPCLESLGGTAGHDCYDFPPENLTRATSELIDAYGLPRTFDGRIELRMLHGRATEAFCVEVRFLGGGSPSRDGLILTSGSKLYRIDPRIGAFVGCCARLALEPPSAARRDGYHDALDRLLGPGAASVGDKSVFLRQVASIKADWVGPAGAQQLHVTLHDSNGGALLVTKAEEAFQAHVDDPAPTGVRPIYRNHETAFVIPEHAVAKLNEIQAIRAMPPEARMREIFGGHSDAFEGFAEHVIGYGLWKTPAIAMHRQTRNDLPPEWVFAKVDGVMVQMQPIEAAMLRDQVDLARGNGQDTVTLDGRRIDLAEAERVLAQIAPVMEIWQERIILGESVTGDANVLDREGIIGAHEAEVDAALTRRKGFPGAVEKYGLIPHVNFLALQRNEPVRPRAAKSRDPLQSTVSHVLRLPPYPHQWDGADAIRRNWLAGSPGVLVCDEPGTGKTALVLAFLAWLVRGAASRQPILIVTKSDLVGRMVAEVSKTLGAGTLGDPLVIDTRLVGSTNAKGKAAIDRIRRTALCVVSYDMLKQHQTLLGQVSFGTVVFDEAQLLANPKTYLRNACYSLKADFRIGMTGTPVENGILDIWSIMDVVSPGRLGTLRDFAVDAYGADLSRKVLDEAFAERTQADLMSPSSGEPVLIRVTKAQVLAHLPEKNVYKPRLYMTAVQEAAYRAILSGCRWENGRPVLNIRAQARMHVVSLHPGSHLVFPRNPSRAEALAWMEMSALTAHLLDVAREVDSLGEKILISISSSALQTRVMACLRTLFPKAHVDGINFRATDKERAARIAAFQNFDGGGFLLITPKVGGVGHTIVEANHVYVLERWWNPARELQVMDRVHRIGQTKAVHIHLPQAIYRPEENLSMSWLMQRAHDRKLKESFLVVGESRGIDAEIALAMAA